MFTYQAGNSITPTTATRMKLDVPRGGSRGQRALIPAAGTGAQCVVRRFSPGRRAPTAGAGTATAREVRERREVVAEHRGRLGEPIPCELMPSSESPAMRMTT